MSKFIRLQMFLEQSKKHKGNADYGSASFAPTPQYTFSQWKVGFWIKNSTEEFKITGIKSSDGAMHNEDTTVTLESAAGEKRELKGSSVRSGYSFVSVGDVEMPKTEVIVQDRIDCMPMLINIAGIREFYPRKNAEGTRILMLDKTAYVVADLFPQVETKIAKAGGYIGAGVVGETNTNTAG